jgi:predicted DNA-binding transcriptional regulator AlpA
MRQTMEKRLPLGIEHFEKLPDLALVNLPVLCTLYTASRATIWRRVKAGLIPAPVKDGRSTRWIVGDLRRALTR